MDEYPIDIMKEVVQKREAGMSLVLVTIVRTEGSTPRSAGAKMIVFPDGMTSGSVGGGVFEKTVVEDCLSLLRGDTLHSLKTFAFSGSEADGAGMCCGGEVEVFMEVLAPHEKLFVFGGGHIAQSLVRIAQSLDFKIIVIDDRQQILDQYKNPVETIRTDASYTENIPRFDSSSYIVIVTRSHASDRRVLARVINENVAYLGMIGSAKKISETAAFLEAHGISKSLLENVHTPIGLAIGAEGPHEIAVSIAAELVAARRKRQARQRKDV